MGIGPPDGHDGLLMAFLVPESGARIIQIFLVTGLLKGLVAPGNPIMQ